jgi:hypothetical protein
MSKFLSAVPWILDGQMRLIPPRKLATINVQSTVTSARMLLDEAENHGRMGRVPILKEATRNAMIGSAAKFEREYYRS